MKYSLFAASVLASLGSASSVGRREVEQIEANAASSAVEVYKRATNQAPNGYAPGEVDCPSTRPSIRKADALSKSESDWLNTRRPKTVDPMRELLTRINIDGFDAGKYIDDNRDNTTNLPNIGIAFSGGGYRAMLNGAGALAAFDNRTPNATNSASQLGGLLQASTYIAGLSGGGWLVGSIYMNNFTSVQNIIDQNEDGDIWQLGNSILEGPKEGGIQILNSAQYYSNLVDTVTDKADAAGGFDTSLTDYWARALSFQFVNASDGGPGYTWSSIQDDPDFKNADAPFPILIALERAPGQAVISLNSTNIEFNPFEMGSFDPTLYGFAPLKYIGSNFTNGEVPENQKCIRGFDNGGFVMGTSSSLFNQIILQFNDDSGAPDLIKSALKSILGSLGDNDNDIADYTPNPFQGYNNRTNPSADTNRLTLVDGGEDLQNIPLNPLIQPHRDVDVIFAIDSSADTVDPTDSAQNWPNGTSLVATYERTSNASIQNSTAFPYIPDQNTFVNLGLNNRPTFFGCDSGNLTGRGVSPLIVYLPNSPYVFLSNVSTFAKLSFNNSERDAMIQNGYDVATMGNNTRSGYEDWTTCVGCAIISRSLNRTNTDVPQACQQCFDKYCWNGTRAENTPAPYWPDMVFQEVNVKSGVGKFLPNVVGVAVAAAVSGLLMM
ncbi:Lysophospholipase 1 [Didymosphaeria variabile]|uniref:Lysophospholipase n=1 Tax=Didymosphaeria variabile TaxID=1932322 RepID=A0A9W9CFQ3_9PLEO|nr:Lysophospholipase 1 [Didymosphaeria variabile]KAJ4359720.1 Lysophospholipase 1 [Didymosphaeria variabile]